MKPITALIVVDKPNKKLEKFLKIHPEIKINGYIYKIEKLFSEISQNQPNLIFLFPDGFKEDEINLLNNAMKNKFPFPDFIIISENQKKWKKELNDTNTLFISKPLCEVELNQAIKQIHINSIRKENSTKIELVTVGHNNMYRIILPILTGLKNIVLDEILYIQRDKENNSSLKVYYNSTESEYLASYLSINQLYKLLNPFSFIQVDRNTIINLKYLREIETKTNICILTKNAELVKLKISKRRLKEYRQNVEGVLFS